MKAKLGTYLASKAHLFVLPLTFVLFVEFLHRDDIGNTLLWCVLHVKEWLLNDLIAFGLYGFVVALAGEAATALWIVSGICLVVALVSGAKVKIWGAPLFPWDVVFGNETMEVVRQIPRVITWSMAAAIVGFAAACALLVRFLPGSRARLRWPGRIALAALCMLLLYNVYTDKPLPVKSALSIATTPWDQAASYAANGFALSTAMNLKLLNIEKPPGYDRSMIDEIAGQIERKTNIDSRTNPNVIVVLSEAFWDPTVIEGISFSRDPIPFLHSLQGKYPSGWLLSPQFGGGTANVEFEVLTGHSMRFLPDGSLPYVEYVNREVDSLASIFARQGYTSTAINPLDNWFFNSRKVYRSFGFSRFISSEFFPPAKKGLFLADDEVANQIIRQSRESAGPDFIFANTMENHWPYYPGKFEENTIKVTGNVSEESRGMLETYAQGIADADRMLEKLADHFAQTGEPTIIVFFGDHLPTLGDDYAVYKDAKYISGDDDPHFLEKMYSVPFVVWDNYLPEHKETLRLSPSFLGPYVLNLAGKEGTYYTDYLYSLWQRIPVIPPESKFAAYGIRESDLEAYRYLEHDTLFGAGYAYEKEGLHGRIIDPNYTLGYGEMVIESASLSGGTGGTPAAPLDDAGSGTQPASAGDTRSGQSLLPEFDSR